MRWRVWRRRSDQDFDDEVRTHIAIETDRLIEAGIEPSTARARALRAFGNVAGARERFHDAHHWVWLEQFARDVGYAWRGLWHSPAFLATSVLTLAVGLGLVTIVFTIFNAYVLRPFAVRNPYGLYEIAWHSHEAGGRKFRWSHYEAIRARQDLFESVIADGGRVMTSKGNTLAVGFVSGNYFEALGVPMQLGRGVAEYDTIGIGDAPIAVLSDQTWTRLFDRDPAVLGRKIELNDHTLVVVGVTRQAFQGLDDTPEDLWLPVTMVGPVLGQDIFSGKQPRVARVVVRLKPGITASQAQSALTLEPFESRVVGRLDAVRPELRVQATPVRLSVELLAVLSPVFAAFVLVLVAACANASNVMLARATARNREIAVRLALGASRGRVVRQLLTEGLLVSVLAAGAGFGLASLALRGGLVLFLGLIPSAVSSLVRVVPLEFDLRVFFFALGVASCTTLMFALLPALQATRLSLTDAIRGQISGAIRSSTLRNFLVGGQVAISLALLIVAATLVRNSGAIRATDLGFDSNGVLSVNQRGDNKALTARAVAALAADPRIQQVVVTSRNPLFGQLPVTPIIREGLSVLAASYMFVSPEYFSMLKIPIVHGRGFRPEEAHEESGVAVISAAGARTLWPGEDPLGKTLRIQLDPDTTRVAETVRMMRSVGENAPGSRVVTVVGVAQDVVSGLIYQGKDNAHLYFPTTPAGPHAEALLVRSRPGPDLRPEALQPLLQRAHPDPLLFETIPLEQMVAVQAFPLLIASWIGTLLGGVALILSVSGLYGVLTYTLGQRAPEIAIRMALGATATAVVRLVVRQSARLAGVGAAIGLLFAFSVMKILSAFVHMAHLDNVSVVDAGAFAAGSGLVATAVVLASYAPARRATRTDPARVLKSQT
jgi:putative ABC transport system permease protein